MKKKLVNNTAQGKEENNTIVDHTPKQENNNYPTLNSTVVTYSYAKNGAEFLSTLGFNVFFSLTVAVGFVVVK